MSEALMRCVRRLPSWRLRPSGERVAARAALVVLCAAACGGAAVAPPSPPVSVVWSQASARGASGPNAKSEVEAAGSAEPGPKLEPSAEPAARESASQETAAEEAASQETAAQEAEPELGSEAAPVPVPPKRSKKPAHGAGAVSNTVSETSAEDEKSDGRDACRAGHFSVTAVRKACAARGRAGAKGVMRRAIAKARAAGTTLGCGDCHRDQQSYRLKPDAVARLRRWLD